VIKGLPGRLAPHGSGNTSRQLTILRAGRLQEVPHWSTVSSTLTYAEWMLIGASCLNGLAISYAGLRVQQLVTATTFMVLTNVNKFVVIIFGVVALHDPLSARSAFGVLLAMGGGVWYAQARAKAPEERKELLLPLQNLKRATNL